MKNVIGIVIALIIFLGTGWLDQGMPWAIFTAEEMVYNVDVQETIRGRGISTEE